jgi:hypothetical protein
MTEEKFRSIMLADNGAILIDDTDEHLESGRAIVIREEWLDQDGFNLVTYFGIASQTLYVTDPVLLVPAGKLTGKLELTSGSVWHIR